MFVKNNYEVQKIIQLDLSEDFLFIDVLHTLPKSALFTNKNVVGLRGNVNFNTAKVIIDGSRFNIGHCLSDDIQKVAIFAERDNLIKYTPLLQAFGFKVFAIHDATGLLSEVDVPMYTFSPADSRQIPNLKSYLLSIIDRERVRYMPKDEIVCAPTSLDMYDVALTNPYYELRYNTRYYEQEDMPVSYFQLIAYANTGLAATMKFHGGVRNSVCEIFKGAYRGQDVEDYRYYGLFLADILKAYLILTTRGDKEKIYNMVIGYNNAKYLRKKAKDYLTKGSGNSFYSYTMSFENFVSNYYEKLLLYYGRQ